MGFELCSLTEPRLIFPDLAGGDRASVLRELSIHLADRGYVKDADDLYCRLQEREELGSTGIGSGVAVPHCKVKGLDRVLVSVGVSDRGVEFESADGEPVKVLFVVLSPADQPAAHLQSLAAISRWVKTDHHLERILSGGDACGDPERIFEVLQNDQPVAEASENA